MRNSPVFDRPVMDPGYHDAWARSIVAGAPITDGEPYFRAPLYPWLLAAVYRVGGGNPLHPRIVQSVIGTGTLLLMYGLGIRLFGRRVALLSVFLALLYPLFPYFDGELLITSLAVFLDTALLLALVAARDRGGRVLWIVAGGLLGLAALARPNILLFAAGIPVWLMLCRRRSLLREVLFPTLLTAAVAVAVIAPVTVRNVREGGDRVWIASQGGINFYLGNHPGADGWSATAPGIRKDWSGGIEDSYLIAKRDLGHDPKPSEVSAYWYGRGLAFLRENPAEGARLLAKKAYLLFYGEELSNNQIIPFAARYSRVFRALPLGYGLLAALGLFGIARSYRDRRRAILLLFLGLYGATIILFFVCSRYRMPLVPVMLLFAASGLLELGRDFHRRRFPAAAGKAAVLILLVFLLRHDFGVVGKMNWTLGYEGEGKSLLERGDLAGAEERFRAAIGADPDSRNAWHDLGIVLRERGDFAGAEGAFRRSVALDDRNAEAYNNLALTLAAAGRPDEAVRVYRKGIGADPRHPGIRVNLAVLLQREERYEEAAAQYRAFLLSGIRDGRVNANLGLCLIRMGETEAGEAELRRGITNSPDQPGPPLLLAEHLAGSGRKEEARTLLEEARKRMPDDLSLEAALRNLESGAGL
ncbi:MAG: tetratricopeptide repeat protein [Candidatus Eisenbacteria bacterium]